MNILVSVIIPMYKRPALIIKCLEQLEKQEFNSGCYEVIVISDGPDEMTHSLIRQKFENKPTFLITCASLPQKRGPAAARNAGWKKAKGELILFTDDDCLPRPDWVQQFYKAWQATNEKQIVFTGRIIVPASIVPTDFEKNTSHLETAGFVTANCACSKAALETVNGFDENFTIAWREDSDLEFRFIINNIGINKIPEAVVVHPVRAAPWGISLKEQKKSMFDALLYRKHPVLFKEKIRSGVLWTYLFMVIFLTGSLILWMLQERSAAVVLFAAWFILWCRFLFQRLAGTSKSLTHIAEMILTSLAIPFVSLYWNIYGYIKFKATDV